MTANVGFPSSSFMITFKLHLAENKHKNTFYAYLTESVLKNKLLMNTKKMLLMMNNHAILEFCYHHLSTKNRTRNSNQLS